MNNYDLLILSADEFENFTRDLLQAKLNVFIESFTSGPDGGIDLRYATDKNKKIIIQAKRYKDYNSLINNLKKEIKNPIKLNPERYIISTTVGLTPKNKEDILKLFSPHIKSTEDIIGNDDLQNLLSLHKKIELKYFKLWITSTRVLEKTLHSKIYNQSEFEIEEIRNQVKLFVQNRSFHKALSILSKYKYVIISGIPGIGKTTLARMLTLRFLSQEYNEFIYLNSSIDEAYQYFNINTSQIFLFDDFLGKNFFQYDNNKNEDAKIIKLINKIRSSNNKLIIFTTREYILNQAMFSFEEFTLNHIDIAKCTIDLTSYTSIIKAKILYNHMFFAEIPKSHLSDLMKHNNLSKIVNHKNYNPRIIEAIINKKIWTLCNSTDFSNQIKSYFDNPESVWLHTFQKALDPISKYTLLVLLTLGTPLLLEDLEEALTSFLKNNQSELNLFFDPLKFNKSIKELENTFIKTQIDEDKSIIIEYQNPSIQDFLLNYIRDKKYLIKNLINGAIFKAQFFTIFTSLDEESENYYSKIKLSPELAKQAFEKIKSNYHNLKNLNFNVQHSPFDENEFWSFSIENEYSFLYTLLIELQSIKKEVEEFVRIEFNKIIYIQTYDFNEQDKYIKIFEMLKHYSLEFDGLMVIDSFFKNLINLNNFINFISLRNILPDTYKTYTSSRSFEENLRIIVNEELKSATPYALEELAENMIILSKEFDFDFEQEFSTLNYKLSEKRDSYNEYYDEERSHETYAHSEYQELDEEKQIEDLFNGLLNQ
ncbi:nSTAND3 domain-containing NTPase [Arsenicibacter rosenii]|uniref:Uncharacterized protein n=1 Tax=Arsenicibacter rosenii TaxID=1750698 RepID=A0A1S2VQZ8_9BACT|nr:restriction endonuclease [Arsenicibacter rosenii]OIN61164.1 hypothetical protein BLX24_03640 [Arsenicibacter rosenii]